MGIENSTEKGGGWTRKKVAIAFVLLSIGAILGAVFGVWRDVSPIQVLLYSVFGVWIWSGVLSVLFWLLDLVFNRLNIWPDDECRTCGELQS